MATNLATKSSITLKGSVEIVTEFFGAHNILAPLHRGKGTPFWR